MDQNNINPLNNDFTGEEEAINLKAIFLTALIYWKWILASVIVFVVLGYLYSKSQPMVYESTSAILVIDNDKSKSNVTQISLIKDFGDNNIDDEVELLKSHPIALEVADSLKLYVNYYTTNFLGRREDLYTSSPFELTLSRYDIQSIKSPMLIKFTPDGKNGYKVTWKDVEGVETVRTVSSFPCLLKLPIGLAALTLRRPNAKLNTEIEVQLSDLRTAMRSVLGTISASPVKDGNVVNLTVRSSNSRKSMDMLTQLMAAYNRDAIAQVNLSSLNSRQFIDDRLKYLTTELSDVEKSVESYKRDNNLTDVTAEAELYLTKGSTIESKLKEVETQISLIKFVEDFLNAEANRYALIPNLGIADPSLIAVINGYNQYLLTRDRMKLGSSVDNPMLKGLNDQIAAARKSIFVGINNARKGLLIARRDVSAQDGEMLTRMKQIPRQEREFIEIKRQQKIKEQLYIFLLQKREEASLTMAITVPKARIIREADSSYKVAPKGSMIMLASFLIGFFLPLLIIFILNKLNTHITSIQEVEKHTNVSVIAELSHNEDAKHILLPHEEANNTHAERFRLLRTRMQFTLDYPTEKVILVTSTRPGEGKTFVSSNLSVSMAMAEKKVILVGLDLRKPQLSKIFGLKKAEGSSSYLSGQITDLDLLIQKTEYQYLDILPAGSIPPNPNELLMKERLLFLFEELKKKYDYIVVDSAPVGAVSDTILINRAVDVTLYICRANYSEKNDVEFLNRLCRQNTLKQPYLVINDVVIGNPYYYRKYMGGGYSYEYGYKSVTGKKAENNIES